ncbi:class IV adenylate cyclase [Rhodobacterales bacterium HKCCE4037]|nr:class IV adenylate cyclase [Rhodobacterales bacterium HKCCE4037]
MTDDAKSLATKGMLADPGDHFRGRYEVERKLRVEDIEPVRQRLEAARAVPFTLGNTETDVFLDLADGRLEANNQSHTLRVMEPSGRVLWISKGPRPDECVAMDLAEYDKALAMLTSLGFAEVRRITKRRDIYFLGDLHVTLDRVDGLGDFVEVAAMTDDEADLPRLRDKIAEAVAGLGLDPRGEESRSYREMLFG